ncbi:helix-turn-helix domain-containing protein [Paenibacillus sp. GXUN7292]|uniref:helix-turn-helix domain-containing protein n=1 Tax=Paenibacillus sp. GXUN7292 TaxID=3422499 RepID=UPI003D7D1DD1
MNQRDRDQMQFSKRLQQARKNKGYTQQDLADTVNTKKTTISNYETGYSTPSNKMIVELANALDVTTDFLLGRIDSPKKDESPSLPILDTNELWTELKNLDNEDVILLNSLIKRLKKNKYDS